MSARSQVVYSHDCYRVAVVESLVNRTPRNSFMSLV